MFRDIYRCLKQAGFDVYSIGQHEGLCERPYVVVRENARAAFKASLSRERADVIVFCPLGVYSQTRPFMDSVIQALRALKQLKFTGIVTPVVIDEKVKAYTCSALYEHFKRRGF